MPWCTRCTDVNGRVVSSSVQGCRTLRREEATLRRQCPGFSVRKGGSLGINSAERQLIPGGKAPFHKDYGMSQPLRKVSGTPPKVLACLRVLRRISSTYQRCPCWAGLSAKRSRLLKPAIRSFTSWNGNETSLRETELRMLDGLLKKL